MKEKTDVIIVGGGGAACRAAIEAAYNNVKVTMVLKGELGKSGATAYQVTESAAFNVPDGQVDKRDNPDNFYDDIIQAGLGMTNPKLARILAEEAQNSLEFLEKMGVIFEKDEKSYLEFQACYSSLPRSHVIKGHGEPIVRALKNEIKRLRIKVLEECVVTNIFQEEEEIQGIGFLDEKGNYFIIESKALVLATGGAGQLFSRNLNPSEITGDGYSLGYQAGAKLINLEFMQAGLGIIYPITNLLNQWIWCGYPRISNKEKKDFLGDYLPVDVDSRVCMENKSLHYPFTSRDNSRYIDIAIQGEIDSGRGSKHNGVYLDLSDLSINSSDSPNFRKMLPLTLDWLSKRGLDLSHEPIEIASFGHAVNGGLWIDEEAATNVKGLFAAGEVAGGPHGADRLGGNMMVTCQVFGARAGKFAASYSQKKKMFPSIDHKDINNAKKEIFTLLKKDINEKYFRKKLQEDLNRGLLVRRSAKSLNICLDTIRKIKAEITQTNEGENINFQNLELMNLLTVGELMTMAAFRREESRGSHFRMDFPKQDDKNWSLAQIVQKKKEKPNFNFYKFH